MRLLIRSHRFERSVPGFSLLELLIALAVIGLLAALLFPVFSGARRQARVTTCTANLRQLGQGLEMYRQDWGQYAPEGWIDTYSTLGDAPDPLAAYTKSDSLYRCSEAYHPPYIFRASFDVAQDNGPGPGDDRDGASDIRLFALEPASVIVYCQHRIVFDAHGKQTGFYLALHEDQSVTRVNSSRLTAWTYHNGQWLPPGKAQPHGDEDWPQIDVFPGEPFPLPFLDQ